MSHNRTKDFGLLIERRNNYGTEYVIARIVNRSDDDKPLGCDSNGELNWHENAPKHLHGGQLDGLCMHGFISDFGDCDYIGFQPEYRDVYAVDLPKVERMRKTLQRVSKQLAKDKAYEAGDIFLSLAKALKLSFVVHRTGKIVSGGAWNDNEWHFMGIEEGRNYFRNTIEQARDDVRKKLGKVA
jgi:hypothetical protein